MRRWTDDEVKLLDIFDNATVAKITGRTAHAVAAKRSGAKRYDPFALTKCAECGKMFYMPDPGCWVYKRIYKDRLKHFCSYHCMRKWENDHERKKENAK